MQICDITVLFRTKELMDSVHTEPIQTVTVNKIIFRLYLRGTNHMDENKET